MRLAEEYGLEFLETSAMSSVNVEQAFVGRSRHVKKRVETEGPATPSNPTSVKLNNQAGGSYLNASCCYGGGSKKPQA